VLIKIIILIVLYRYLALAIKMQIIILKEYYMELINNTIKTENKASGEQNNNSTKTQTNS
jgi:hypothetical protein